MRSRLFGRRGFAVVLALAAGSTTAFAVLPAGASPSAHPALSLSGQVQWATSSRPAAVAVTHGTCPSSGEKNHDWLSNFWVPSNGNIAALRAVITLRKTGTVCTSYDGSLPAGFAIPWVAIEQNGSGGGISQIGWDHDATMGFCRFWEYNNNKGFDTFITPYDCGQDAGGTDLYFKVDEDQDPTSNAWHFGLYTCGTSDWGTCTKKSEGPLVSNFSNPAGLVSQEANYAGADSCINHFMGGQSNQTKFANIMGKATRSDSWQTRDLFYQDSAGCAKYVSSTHTNTTFSVYDSRD